MKIAVPTNDGISISEHFGRSSSFLVFEVDNGTIKSRETRRNGMGHSHDPGECHHDASGGAHRSHDGILSALAGCDVVLCAGMGWRAAEALKSSGIATILTAASVSADETVAAYLQGNLPSAEEGFCHCHH